MNKRWLYANIEDEREERLKRDGKKRGVKEEMKMVRRGEGLESRGW